MMRMTRIETAAEAQAWYAAAGNTDAYRANERRSGQTALPRSQRRCVAVERGDLIARARAIRSPRAKE
jgi:hypothetical protein